MALTENIPNALTFTALGAKHLDGAAALTREAGWNETVDDWRMMLSQGTGIGFTNPDDSLVASAICLPYDSPFGWISMVLVTRKWRKKGLATNLLQRCIEILEDTGRTPVLDATPDGVPVYTPLGFLPQFGLTRWQAGDREKRNAEHGSRPISPAELPSVLEIDAAVFGGGRARIIKALSSRAPAGCRYMADGSGFVLARDGTNAMQIGPLAADTDAAAVALLADAVDAVGGPVFIDVADDKTVIVDWLQANGFTGQRPFTRMAKGRAEPFGRPEKLYAIAGPELG